MIDTYNFTNLGRLKIYNRISRSLLALSNAERLTLIFVLDRTIGYRKIWAAISLKEFQNGAFRTKCGSRVLVAPGTGLSEDQVKQALRELCKIGAIEVQEHISKDLYCINEHWMHPTLPQNGRLAMWEINESDYEYPSPR